MTIPANNRKYDTTRRRAQAAQTRVAILTAARHLFPEGGYAGTTLIDVAAAAGVAVETIYRLFGSKATLFQGVVEAAIAGGAERAAIPPEERPAIREMAEEADARRVLELHAATQPGIHARARSFNRVLTEAAAVDPDLADVRRRLEAQRLAGMTRLAKHLHKLGSLRPELSIDAAADILWTVNSHAVYELLVTERGWSQERYRDWIAATNVHALLVQA